MRTVIAIKQRTRIALEEKHENFIAATQKKNQFFLKTICTCYYLFSSLRVRRLKGRGRLILSAVKLVPRNKTKTKYAKKIHCIYSKVLGSLHGSTRISSKELLNKNEKGKNTRHNINPDLSYCVLWSQPWLSAQMVHLEIRGMGVWRRLAFETLFWETTKKREKDFREAQTHTLKSHSS